MISKWSSMYLCWRPFLCIKNDTYSIIMVIDKVVALKSDKHHTFNISDNDNIFSLN